MGLPPLWNAKHRSTRSKSSISSLARTPGSPRAVQDGFGVPSPDDPDPFGVRALELAGLAIKEAGSKSRPSSDAFEFKPSPTSPIFRLSTQSIDAAALRDPRRDSKRSIASTDHGTQTANLPSPPATEDFRNLCTSPPPIEEEPSELEVIEESRVDDNATQASNEEDLEELEEVEIGDEIEVPDDDNEIVVEQAMPSLQILTRAQASPVVTKPKLVTIPRRGPPALPVKSPLRQRKLQSIEPAVESDLTEEDLRDDSSSTYSSSPDKDSFDHNEEMMSNPWSAGTSIDTESLRHKDEGLHDLDVPPLSDAEDGSSLAESDDTHLDASQQIESDSTQAPYAMGDLVNTSGETLAISVQAGEGLGVDEHRKRGSIDATANASEQSLTHLVKEAPALYSAERLDHDDAASESSFYDDEPIDAVSLPGVQKEEAFHSASSLPQEHTIDQIPASTVTT